ncbi:PepSY-associated TM helix domain-containing protein [Shewanella waksmanii]|uniref:PepSY-associated TM helix domain-containing protein n=1 Tax=Shewanella waksmanii TaxID=213783 RepID=UPI00373703DA
MNKPVATERSSTKRRSHNKQSLKLARIIHIYVSMALLLLMLFFAVTGITLNHPSWFNADTAESDYQELPLPDHLLPVQPLNTDWQQKAKYWLNSEFDLAIDTAELSEDEVAIVQSKPGRYQSLTIDAYEEMAFYEKREYGVVAILNDLHKGRHSGVVWQWVIDISAILMIIFSLTGAYLLLPQRKKLMRSMGYMGVVSAGCVGIYWFCVI